MSQPFLQLSATGCVVFGRHSAALASQTRQPGSQSRLPWDEAIAALAAQARFARGEDVLSYVKEAISQPQVLVFGELLDLAVVQEVRCDCSPENVACCCPLAHRLLAASQMLASFRFKQTVCIKVHAFDVLLSLSLAPM